MFIAYDLAYWLHIVSYIIWILAFVGSLYYGIKIKLEENVPSQRSLMRSERFINNIGAHIGAVGILISGVVMTSGPQWRWFSFQLYPWLAIKQLLFLVILVLVLFSVRRSVAFKEKLKQEDVSNSEISKLWSKAYRISLWVYILVIVNTLLGLMKPLLSF